VVWRGREDRSSIGRGRAPAPVPIREPAACSRSLMASLADMRQDHAIAIKHPVAAGYRLDCPGLRKAARKHG
jgi:hypothetical protein